MEKLTKKQQGFVKDYLETDNATEAAERNYDVKDRNVAKSIGSENLTKPDVVAVIESLAERIPDDLLERVHLEGLEASKKIFKNNNATKKVEYVGDEPDYGVRHKYLDSAYKIKGTYAPEKQIVVDIEITSPEAKKLAEEYEAKLKKSL